jgi:glycosyltransferase involved in cell wall biosynthesis
MRILHVTTFLQGGAGRIITALAIAQLRAGHEVIVVADAGGGTGYASYDDYIAQLADAHVEFHTVTSTFRRDLALNVNAVNRLRELLGGRPIDVAHTHAAIPTMVTCLAFARRAPVPLVQTMHGWGVTKTSEQAVTDITLLGLADAVVTPSAAARATLQGLGLSEVPVHVIPYGLEQDTNPGPLDAADADLFAALRRSGAAIALCIGTIGERKNQALLVKAVASLDDVAAVFIGDGDAAPLREVAEALGVSARVHVLGYRADASRYLSYADVLVLPSMNEGLPIAVLEAFRAGVPVVGSAIPEIAEAVEDGRTGVLFEPGNAIALAVALRRALEPNARSAMGPEARLVFNARYGVERMISNYEDRYAEWLERVRSEHRLVRSGRRATA